MAALVYVAARAPDAGEDHGALASRFPTPPASAGLLKSPDGFTQLSEQALLHDFAGDLPLERAEALYAVQQRVALTLFSGRTIDAAWHSKPSWYAVSSQDRTMSPELLRFMAQRMGATTIELHASHVSLISHPDEIAALILEAAGQQGLDQTVQPG